MKKVLSLNKQLSHQEIIANIEALLQKFIEEKNSQDLSGVLLIMEIKESILSDNNYIPKIEFRDCST